MRKHNKSLLIIIMTLLMTYSQISHALTIAPVPIEPIYFEPPVQQATDEQLQWNCTALDNAIRYLHPYKYSYKPGFEEDGANKLAVVLVTIDNFPIAEGLAGLGYLAYSAMVEEKEQRRMLVIEQKIAMFQQLKAEKHCYE